MDKKYFTKHLLLSALYLITASAAFYIDDNLFYHDIKLVTLMLLSTLLYPLSRYFTTASAYKLTGPEFWRKDFFIKGDSTGINALFIFFCLVFAIPLGSTYLIFMILKRG
ncbi:Colicin transporter [Pseudomonas sp. IT-P258]|nr:hypothetical protein ASD91_05825 [Pseudomonas sp. Root68]KRB66537.1 hypothetical protein ASD95_07085 [Pseudomonas sp. Root71]